MHEEFNEIKKWILSSGLAISNKYDPNLGGIYSFFDSSKNEYGFIYPEITGYYLSSLRFLYEHESNPNLIEKCKISADWLIKIYDKYGGIVQGIYSNPQKENLVYTFDTGICAQGILDCYLLTKEKKYLDFAQMLLNWIKNKAINFDGTIFPIYSLSKQKFQEDNSLWYKQKGCFHIKNVIPFCTLYSISKDSDLLETINKISNTFMKFQNVDGSISIHENSNVVHMHTLCYSLEGLLHAFFTTKNMEFLDVCKKALDWVIMHIQNDGSTYLWFNSKYRQAKTSYHVAQLIRLMILVDKIENNEKYLKYAKSLKLFLNQLQAKSNDSKIDGGYYEEYHKTFFGWKKNPKLNSWGSIFALQSIYWLDNYDKITISNSLPYLY